MANPPFTTNFVNGTWIALWLGLLLISPTSEGFVSRQLWLFSQLNSQPSPSLPGETRQQLGLELTHYSDTVASQLGGSFELGPVELRLGFSQRVFLEASERGEAHRGRFEKEQHTVFAEVGRYFVSNQSHFGRIGFGFHQFLPRSEIRWLSLAGQAGILSTPSRPWGVEMRTGIYFPRHETDKIFLVEGRVLRANAFQVESLSLGAMLGFIHQAVDTKVAPLGRYEYILFTLGPLAELQTTSLGRFHLAMHWRVALDREAGQDEQRRREERNPSEVLFMPDVTLSWRVPL